MDDLGVPRRGLGWLTLGARISLVAALLWCLMLVVAAFTLPVYGFTSGSSSATTDGATVASDQITGTATLVEVNGVPAVLVVLIPLVLTLVVGALLVQGSRAARISAWVGVTAFGVFAVLGLLSVGLFLLPAVVLLVVACASQSNRARTVGV